VKSLILAVLAEAHEKFGPATDENRHAIARWAQARVAQLTGKQPAAVLDAKMAAAGDDFLERKTLR
jgi:hypothetical protein